MLTFRSSKIIYYGPHSCENCGEMVVKMGYEFGGNTFNQPDGPIYPNTEWYPHVCNPEKSKRPSSQSTISVYPSVPLMGRNESNKL